MKPKRTNLEKADRMLKAYEFHELRKEVKALQSKIDQVLGREDFSKWPNFKDYTANAITVGFSLVTSALHSLWKEQQEGEKQ